MIPTEKPGSPAELLEHHGVLGMKWGRRSGSSGGSDSNSKMTRKDATWLKKTHGSKSFTPMAGVPRRTNTQGRIIKAAQKNMKPEINALKKRPEYSSFKAKRAIRKAKYDLSPKDPIAAKYNKEASKIYMKHVKAAAPELLSISPSGKMRDVLIVGKNHWYVGINGPRGKAIHSDIPDMSQMDVAFKVRPIFDNEGYIIDFESTMLDSSMAQTMNLGINVLAHMGIKI